MQAHALLLALSLLLAPQPALQDGDAVLRRVSSLMRSRKWLEVEQALESFGEQDVGQGQAWFDLASELHQRKQYGGAIRANQRAARFPLQRATALYNLACAQSLNGEVQQAAHSLSASIEAGFLDFDLMAADSDLVALRAEHAVPLPPPHDFEELRARNGVRMPYLTFGAPAGDRDGPERPVLIALAPGGKRSADWMAQELWFELRDTPWTVVVVAAPERGWFTHPTHHALEDLLKKLKKVYRVAGERFHLFGIASGCRPATTYSRMSGEYFQSTTLVSSSAWASYDDSDWSDWRDQVVHQIVGGEAFTLEADHAVHQELLASRVASRFTVIPGDGLLVPSLRGKVLLAAIEEGLAR